jgi:hypothetical protein
MVSESREKQLARLSLGIEDPSRLDEIDELSGLLAWMSEGVRSLQDTSPSAPSPAIQFLPEKDAPEYWRENVDDR